MVAEDSLAFRNTEIKEENEPPDGDAVTVGIVVSMTYVCAWTGPLFPAVSLAKYFRVVADEIDRGKEYFALEMLGVLPSRV